MATITGTPGNDTLTGDTALPGTFNDSINGLANDDILNGLTGNDTLIGSDGNDSLFGGTQNDRLYGGVGSDQLFGEAGTESLFGGDGNDRLDGGADNDTLSGDDGNDTLIGGLGADWLFGGDDTDTADYSSSTTAINLDFTGTDRVTSDGSVDSLSVDIEIVIGSTFNDTMVGDNSADHFYGGLGNDTLSGLGGSDSLFGDGGNDSLSGGSSSDTLGGGTGDDTLLGGSGADSMAGGQGLDFVDYTGSTGAVSVSLISNTGSGGDAEGDVYDGVDGIIGSSLGDTLVGFDGFNLSGPDVFTNIIYGAGGGDSILGNGGPDSLFGGTGNDTIFGGDGDEGSIGGDWIRGDEGNDSIFGGTGNDTISGGNDQDSISGGTGNDSLLGDGGIDSIDGGAGNDVIRGGAEDDSLYGGTGNDTFGYGVTDVQAADTTFELVFGGGGPGATDGDKDVLDLSAYGQAFGWASVVITLDAPGSENGTVRLYNGPPFSGNGPNFLGTIQFDNIENIIRCFTPGTMILTARGEVAVEDLVAGDLVMTRDNGLQPLRWVGQQHIARARLMADPDLQPVRIAKGALGSDGPVRSMLVSPQHRILLESARAELLFGEEEVLVPAKHLIGQADLTRALPEEGVTYVHILFDRHEIVRSDGIWTESFQPAARTLSAMEDEVRDEILKIFPELATDVSAYDGARLSLKAHEARVLFAR